MEAKLKKSNVAPGWLNPRNDTDGATFIESRADSGASEPVEPAIERVAAGQLEHLKDNSRPVQ